MFLFKFFKISFNLPKLLSNSNQKLWKIILYFILIILIANFPQTFDVYRHGGSRLDFVIEDFSKEIPIGWILPNDIEISGGKLINNGDNNIYKYEHKGITYIINNTNRIDVNEYKNHIIFSETSLIYIDSDGNYLEEHNYRGFEDTFRFRELNISHGEEKEALFNTFAKSIELSFSNPIVLYTVLRNNITQIFINIIYVLILAGFVQLFRFRYQNFLTYIDSVKFVVLSLGLPAILSFIIGVLAPAFAPVVFQLASGMTIMLVMLIFSKKTFS